MCLSKKQLQTKASDLFTYFEFNKFRNELSYSKKTNLLLEFCDYIEHLSDWEIADILNSDNNSDVRNFRKIINNGADIWLGDLIKTISYKENILCKKK